jgi:hypothetical protein
MESKLPMLGYRVQEEPWLPKDRIIKTFGCIYVPCIYPFIFIEGVTEDSLNRAIEFAKNKVLRLIKQTPELQIK